MVTLNPLTFPKTANKAAEAFHEELPELPLRKSQTGQSGDRAGQYHPEIKRPLKTFQRAAMDSSAMCAVAHIDILLKGIIIHSAKRLIVLIIGPFMLPAHTRTLRVSGDCYPLGYEGIVIHSATRLIILIIGPSMLPAETRTSRVSGDCYPLGYEVYQDRYPLGYEVDRPHNRTVFVTRARTALYVYQRIVIMSHNTASLLDINAIPDSNKSNGKQLINSSRGVGKQGEPVAYSIRTFERSATPV
ncbi:hypothetical protein J6590_055511 [Homalodisca vitripennis]|nr:hypothetical protein J6590_055511 [Homalodisca vitripennis]